MKYQSEDRWCLEWHLNPASDECRVPTIKLSTVFSSWQLYGMVQSDRPSPPSSSGWWYDLRKFVVQCDLKWSVGGSCAWPRFLLDDFINSYHICRGLPCSTEHEIQSMSVLPECNCICNASLAIMMHIARCLLSCVFSLLNPVMLRLIACSDFQKTGI